jgi:hypothetical protein
MGVKKYFASQDNTITNAFKANLSTRGTGSNMGAADILETFVIHGQTSASISATNAEQSRVIIQFPVDQIMTDVTGGILPTDTSSIQYKLKLYNAPHGSTVPLSYSLDVCMLSQAWSEGRGLDMDNYTDIGFSNWVNRSSGSAWNATGGGYLGGVNTSASYYFETGLENLEIDVSEMVYKWLGGTDNYGFLIKFPDVSVSGSDTLYTKKFFSRTSEFFLLRPVLEARWDSSRKDNRGNFFVSSSNAPATDNLNTIYLYNNIKGQFTNLPGLDASNTLNVSFYSGSTTPSGDALEVTNDSGATTTTVVAGQLVENGATITGVYTASFASTSSLSPIFDVWYTGSTPPLTQFYTGSFEPQSFAVSDVSYQTQYITSVTNLMPSYIQGETPRIRVFPRLKNWSPTIYTIATQEIKPHIIEDAYYKVSREIDDLEVIAYATGSTNKYATRLSYDMSGSYFKLDTSCLDPGYSYEIKFTYYTEGYYQEQPESFKFRIDEP